MSSFWDENAICADCGKEHLPWGHIICGDCDCHICMGCMESHLMKHGVYPPLKGV